MCDKLPYCAKNIDPCLTQIITSINTEQLIDLSTNRSCLKTLASCCGHGKYDSTIIVKNLKTGHIFEWFSGVTLESKYKNGKVRKRFYKRDGKKKGDHFYLPEVTDRR